MNLFIDVGNTNIKINFCKDGQEYFLNYETSISYTVDTFFANLPEEITKANINNVFICSVVPEKYILFNGVFKKYFKITPIKIAFPLKTGLQIKAANPKMVGSDLIAIGAFLNSKTKERAVMVNMGTATTIVVTEKGSFEGAIISPGLNKSFHSLISGASKLNNIDLKTNLKIAIGKTTQEAISIGVIDGHIGMIRSLMAEINAKKLYISGGLSKNVTNKLSEFEFVKEATIAGMKEIVKHNNYEISY